MTVRSAEQKAANAGSMPEVRRGEQKQDTVARREAARTAAGMACTRKPKEGAAVCREQERQQSCERSRTFKFNTSQYLDIGNISVQC